MENLTTLLLGALEVRPSSVSVSGNSLLITPEINFIFKLRK